MGEINGLRNVDQSLWIESASRISKGEDHETVDCSESNKDLSSFLKEEREVEECLLSLK